MQEQESSGANPGWRRALALLVVVMASSVAQPLVLVAVPLLVLIGLGGIRSTSVFLVTVAGMFIVMVGPRDDLWYLERAWALIAGGTFAALAVGVPHWRFASKAFAAVGATVGIFAAFLASRRGAWQGVDWSVAGAVQAGYQNALDAMVMLRDGEALEPAFVSSMMWLSETTVEVFPARLAIQTMAALAIAWWLYVRLIHRTDHAIGPVDGFRFNDHLVWLMIAGLAMLALRPSEAITRVGANLAVWMGALYALRGTGVFVHVNGGISFVGMSLFAIGLLFAAPVVIGFAVILGMADTWLDLRARADSMAT